MVHSSNNNIDRMDENNEGVTCSVDHLLRSSRKIQLPIIRISRLKEPIETTVVPTCSSRMKSFKRNESNKCNLNPPVPIKPQKRKLLLDRSHSYCKKKQVSKKGPSESCNTNKINKKKINRKKKRSTHIIIWESKLTGAQRVSKRLSNLRNKNKALEKVETFNIVPIAVIKKQKAKRSVQKKTKMPIKKKPNKKQTVSLVYNRSDSVQDQNVYSKKEKFKKRSTNCKINVNSDQTIQFSIETPDKSDKLEESIDSEINSVLPACPDTNDAEVMDKDIIPVAHEETHEFPSGFDEGMDGLKSVNTTELIQPENVTMANESANAMNYFQEECVDDSDVIIVELEAVEVGNSVSERVSDFERKLECATASDKKDIQGSLVRIPDSVLVTSICTDLGLEGKSAIQHITESVPSE